MAWCEVVFTTDWHCLKLKRFFPEDHLKMTIKEIRKPLDYAIKHAIPTVIFGGDLSDTPYLTSRYIKALIELFLEYKELTFFLMEGNHDYEDKETNSLQFIELCSKLGILKNVVVLTEPKVVKIERVPFNFMPFPIDTFTHKGPCVNVAHIETVGARRDNNRKITKGVTVPNREDQYTLIGHIHKYQQGKNWAFGGGLYQGTFGESLPKGFLHCKFRLKDDKLRHEVKYVETRPDFELINLIVETKDDFKRITKDPLRLYKLFIADGLTVPKRLTLDHPNIMDVQSKKDGSFQSVFNREIPDDLLEGSNVLQDLVNDPLWGLKEYLKQNKLDKAQRKRAIEIVDKILMLMGGEDV